MGHSIFGYIEVRNDDEREWAVYKELETGDVPRSPATKFVFGYGTKSGDFVSLFKDRGLPFDATDRVREDYFEHQWNERPDMNHGGFRETFGHSYAYASELPGFLVERFGPLADAASEYDQARLLVWFLR